MDRRSLGYAFAAGAATFLIVGVAITEAAAPGVEFSLFLGLPAGLVAGSAVAAFVLLRFRGGRGRRAGRALGVFGAGFLVALVLGVALSAPVTLTIGVSVVIGVVAGGAYYAMKGTASAP